MVNGSRCFRGVTEYRRARSIRLESAFAPRIGTLGINRRDQASVPHGPRSAASVVAQFSWGQLQPMRCITTTWETSMPVKVRCSGCQKVLNAPERARGKAIKCPDCATVIKVPAEKQVATKAAAPP